MPHKPYDPLAWVPSPEIVRQKLAETLTLAERLRILLDLSERLRRVATAPDRQPAPPADRQGAGHE
jgi:hypothetical protein